MKFKFPFLLLLIAIAVVSCKRLDQLVSFNLDTKDRGHFVGLPVPAAGLLIAVLPLLMLYNPFDVQLVIINRWFLYALIGAISWLMVSALPLLNLKFKNYSFTDNKARYILLALAIPFILILGWLAVPTIFITYILVSLLFKNQLT
jgi:CDP-diacylglycerol--serine O-phosphatidyltransferase